MQEPASGAGSPECLALTLRRLDFTSKLGVVLAAAVSVGEKAEGLAEELEGLLGGHVGVLVGVEEQRELLVLPPDDAAAREGLGAEGAVPVRRGEDGEGSDGLRHAGEVWAEAVGAVGVLESGFGVVGGFELGLRHGLEAQRFGFCFCHWNLVFWRMEVK